MDPRVGILVELFSLGDMALLSSFPVDSVLLGGVFSSSWLSEAFKPATSGFSFWNEFATIHSSSVVLEAARLSVENIFPASGYSSSKPELGSLDTIFVLIATNWPLSPWSPSVSLICLVNRRTTIGISSCMSELSISMTGFSGAATRYSV